MAAGPFTRVSPFLSDSQSSLLPFRICPSDPRPRVLCCVQLGPCIRSLPLCRRPCIRSAEPRAKVAYLTLASVVPLAMFSFITCQWNGLGRKIFVVVMVVIQFKVAAAQFVSDRIHSNYGDPVAMHRVSADWMGPG